MVTTITFFNWLVSTEKDTYASVAALGLTHETLGCAHNFDDPFSVLPIKPVHILTNSPPGVMVMYRLV